MDLGRDKGISALVGRLRSEAEVRGAVKVTGTWGSFAHLLTSYISEQVGRAVLFDYALAS